MANYALTDWVSETGTLAEVAALVETQLETHDTTKTIRDLSYVKVGNESFKAVLIIDA